MCFACTKSNVQSLTFLVKSILDNGSWQPLLFHWSSLRSLTASASGSRKCRPRWTSQQPQHQGVEWASFLHFNFHLSILGKGTVMDDMAVRFWTPEPRGSTTPHLAIGLSHKGRLNRWYPFSVDHFCAFPLCFFSHLTSSPCLNKSFLFVCFIGEETYAHAYAVFSPKTDILLDKCLHLRRSFL